MSKIQMIQNLERDMTFLYDNLVIEGNLSEYEQKVATIVADTLQRLREARQEDKETMMKLEVGSIIQINNKYPELEGCLMIVDKVHHNYCRAYLTLPNHEMQFYMLEFYEFEVIGLATFAYM